MATSSEYGYWKSYYWGRYTTYRDRYNYINAIKENLDQSGKVKDINNRIDDCVNAMSNALQGSGKFAQNRATVEQKKVKEKDCEVKLIQADSYLTAELTSIGRTRDEAKSNYEYYRQLEKEAWYEEHFS